MFVLGEATCHMFPTADRFEDYRVCNGGQVRLADGSMIPIAGYGNVIVAFRSEGVWVFARVMGVAHVPQVMFNVLSLTSMISKGCTCLCSREGSTIIKGDGESIVFPFCGKLVAQKGFRPGPGSTVTTAQAASTFGEAEAPTGFPDINEYHYAHGHSNESMLRLTASQQGIQLSGKMRECVGCSMARILVRPIVKTMTARAAEKLGRVFVGVSGEMSVPSLGGRRYILVVRDDCTRWTRVYILRDKSDATSAFKMFLAEYRAEGTYSKMAVQSGTGREAFGTDFLELCRQHAIFIMQEPTPENSSENSVVADRALWMIQDAALAARIQATVLYPGAPTYPCLWAEAVSWACDALNRTATTANPGGKSPYELWHGHPPPIGATQPFLRPAICRLKRENNSEPETQVCFYLGPEIKHPRGGMRILTESGSTLIARNLSWRHVPAVSKASSQTSTTSA